MPTPLVALLAIAFPSLQNPSAGSVAIASYLERANQIRRAVYDEAKSGSVVPPRAELEQRVAARMRDLLKDLALGKLDPKDAGDWAGLFRQAGRTDDALSLEKASINYHNVQLMFASVSLIGDLIRGGDDEQAFYLIKHVPDIDASMVGMISEGVYGALNERGYFKSKPEFAQRCLRALRNQIDLSANPMSVRGNAMADFCYVDLSMKMLEAQYELKPTPAILAQMRTLRTRFAKSKSTNAFGQSPAYRIDEFLWRQAAVGKPAPAITMDRELNGFTSLADLKGRVVVLDFMAHWCGPCKAALPWLKGLQDTYGAQGLQTVSITSFYGYFGAKQGLPVGTEFDLMKGFVKDFKMDWPVVFDAKQVTHSRYNVGAIPHLVVIDRKGIVRRIQVGAGAAEEAKTTEVVKALVAEPK